MIEIKRVCDNGPPDNSIVFELGGGATAYEFPGILGGPGLTVDFDFLNTITISGTVNTGATTQTTYSYTISTTVLCGSYRNRCYHC